jgi:hypothetical protein
MLLLLFVVSLYAVSWSDGRPNCRARMVVVAFVVTLVELFFSQAYRGLFLDDVCRHDVSGSDFYTTTP